MLPSLFGTPGREPSIGYGLQSMIPALRLEGVRRVRHRQTAPVTLWLRALARTVPTECGGPGVGAVGMCFTGGFALGMMVDETDAGPRAQPAVAADRALDAHGEAAIGSASRCDLAAVKERPRTGCCVLGLRFTGDKFVPGERFETLREELGDAFIGVEIDSSKGNPRGIPTNAHSVLTEHLVDEPGHPTRVALDQVLDVLPGAVARRADRRPGGRGRAASPPRWGRRRDVAVRARSRAVPADDRRRRAG